MHALITGVSGQDGYYLAKLLISRGYRVFGQARRPAALKPDLLSLPITIVEFDLQSASSWQRVLDQYQPNEIYHLAGVSFVPASWAAPHETISANLGVTVNILDAMRSAAFAPRLFFAGTSEVFGKPTTTPQSESTSMRPLNPYGVTKAASIHMIESYRRRFDLFACSGLLFNHESPRRAPSFVTRKITQAAAAISMGYQDQLVLGNLDVSRDWGYAADYVECMYQMLQADTAEDYVIGSGKLTSLEYVVELAFARVGLDWRNWVSIDPSFVRPNDSRTLVADSSKALRNLGWKAKTSVDHLIGMMVDHDVDLLRTSNSKAA